MLIGIVGFIGSGKGTVGDILTQDYRFTQDSFAKPLKDAVSIIFNWDRELLEGKTKESREWREKPDQYWSEKFGYDFSPRLALQWFGTESARDVFHKDIWVISLLHRTHGKNTVITDVRFKNEMRLIKENDGIVIRVSRGEEPTWFQTAIKANSGDTKSQKKMNSLMIHPSEWDWVGSDLVDYHIHNDSTLDSLKWRIHTTMNIINSKTTNDSTLTMK